MDLAHKKARNLTKNLENLLEGADVRLNTNYFSDRQALNALADKILFTGCIDEFYDFCFGHLEYRSLRFEHERLEVDNYQGNAVINYCEREIPYTRVIEHKHFELGKQPHTVITREYPADFTLGDEPYYPVNDEKNMQLYEKYKEMATSVPGILFGGRLAQYAYFDMDDTVAAALLLAQNEL
jgi:UDP-galactopyranose mutase